MTLRIATSIGLILAVAGCAQLRDGTGGQSESAPRASGALIPPARTPAPAPATAPVEQRLPSAQARAVDDFDLTTPDERAAAITPAAATPGGERSLGTTVASLGDPTAQGFWLETPLVTTETEGRILYPDTGKSANVTLRPIPGASGAGSRISLAAMRVLEAPLTDLPTVEVFAGG